MPGAHPERVQPDHADRAGAAAARPGCCRADDAALLIRADHVWRTVQGMLRITVGRAAPAELPDATPRPLLRAAAAAGVRGG